jgi:glycosyltransferase involved in cell wall biosynthesis
MKERVSKYSLKQKIMFYKSVPNHETPMIYSAHEIFVNLSSSGMYDKTIFEAMACGCLILASNDNLRGQINGDFIFKQGDMKELTQKLQKLLHYSSDEKQKVTEHLRKFMESHSLKNLGNKLFKEIA